jgi:aspartate/methionine/tyrosine aminotransferase
VNFADFQLWREECLRANPDLLDCAETNLYRSLVSLQPKSDASKAVRPIHRCDLARMWLGRYGLPDNLSRRALVCRGVRHALSLIFKELARSEAVLWAPSDVYPTYLELARAAGIEPRQFPTLPEPIFPAGHTDGRNEYLLIANPWKPLGRFLTERECAALIGWLAASPHRYLLMDCVYDLGTPFHSTTQKLLETGRATLLHSVTKGWLWPKTFGVTLRDETHQQWETAFRNDPPSQDQLCLAEQLLSKDASLPAQIVTALGHRRQKLLMALSTTVANTLVSDPAAAAPGCYFFPTALEADQLLREHGILAIPSSAFGAGWNGSVLTSLATMRGRGAR